MENQNQTPHKRRVRYKGKYPKKFEEKYKELQPEKYKDTIEHVIQKGNTPAGMHISIMVKEIIDFLNIQPGEIGFDATLGYGGHTKAMLKCLNGKGHIYATDVDPEESDKTKKRLAEHGFGEDLLTVKLQNFCTIDEIAKEVGAYFMVDMAHIAGLVAGGAHPSPFGYADIITTTTHKTLRGPRGGLIFARQDLAKKVDSAVFPYAQGGPLEHIIAGKAVCAEEALRPSYKEYVHQVVKNCKALSDEFIRLGYKVVTGGTDNHLILLDLSDEPFSGRVLQEECDKIGITLNKNCVPCEKRSPRETSGVRIGTAPMTTRGYLEEDFVRVVHRIDELIKKLREEYK